MAFHRAWRAVKQSNKPKRLENVACRWRAWDTAGRLNCGSIDWD